MQALAEAHKELKNNDVDPEALGIAIVGINEMVLGEVVGHEVFNEKYEEEGPGHSSFFDIADWVAFKNPKRVSRITLTHRETGQQVSSLQFGDYDGIEEGIIEVKPQGFFFFDWLNSSSQLSYCKIYLNFLEHKRQARAAAIGIQIASPQTLEELNLNNPRRS